MSPNDDNVTLTDDQIYSIERPHSNLWSYYLISSLLTGPGFFFVILPFYFRYHSMKYRFSDEGVSMRWGILFRKEINLTYARIQDIHLTSNFVERWLGLARIQIQTASGSAKAEMTIEGIQQYKALRDFLYNRMRGAKGMGPVPGATTPPKAMGAPSTTQVAGISSESAGELTTILREVANELRAIRQDLGSRDGSGNQGGGPVNG